MDLELNWQDNKSFQACCRYMLESGLFADTVLVAKSVNGQLEELLAHRFVLVCYSPILQQELCGTTLNCNGLNKVTVNDISTETLKDVLRFMYHGEITITDENIIDLLRGADRFKIWKLQDLCRDFILNKLTKGTWSSEKRLQFFTQCLENNFAGEYLVKLRLTSADLSGTEYLRLSHQALQNIIGSNHLCISAGHTEVAVLRACMEWARERCRMEGKDMTDQACRDVLGGGLYRVRLPLLSLQEFAQEVTGLHLLSNDQKVKVMEQTIFNKDDADGPAFDDDPRLCFVQGPNCDLFVRSDIDGFGSSEPFELHQIVMESGLCLPTLKIKDANGTIVSWQLDSKHTGHFAFDFYPPLKLQGSKRYTVELIPNSWRSVNLFRPKVTSIRNCFKALLIKPMQALVVHMNLLFNSQTKQSLIVMEGDHRHPICIRHIIQPTMTITYKQRDQKVLIWTYTDARKHPNRMQLFTCAFRSMEDAACFKAAFEKAKLTAAEQRVSVFSFSSHIGVSTTQSQDKPDTGLVVPGIILGQGAPAQSLSKIPVGVTSASMSSQPVPKDLGVSTTQPQGKLEPASQDDGSVATSASVVNPPVPQVSSVSTIHTQVKLEPVSQDDGIDDTSISMRSQPVPQDSSVSTTHPQNKLGPASQEDGSVATSSSMESQPVPHDSSVLTTHPQEKLESASHDGGSFASPIQRQGSAALANNFPMTMPTNIGFVNVATSTTDQGGLVTGSMNPQQGTQVPPIQEAPMAAAAIHSLQDQPASGLPGPGYLSSPEHGASPTQGPGSASSATKFPMAMPNKMGFGNLASGQSPKASPAKHGAAEDGDSEGESEEENTSIEFRPLVSLPVVEVVTGEEQETPLFSERAKLFCFVEKEWKERGLGVMKILHNKETNHVMLLMTRDQVHKVCANHKVKPDMTIAYKAPGDDKILTWRAVDFTDGEPRLEQFACKFKTADIAAAFKSSFEKAINIVKTAVPETVLTSPSTQPIKTAQGQAEVPATEPNTVVSAARPEAVTSSAQTTPVATTTAAGGFSFKPATTAAFGQHSASSMLQSIAAQVGMKKDVSSEAATEMKPTFGGFTFASKPVFSFTPNDQSGTPKADESSITTVPQGQVTAKPNLFASFTFSPPKTAANVSPFANTPVSEADNPKGQSGLFDTVTSSSPAPFASLASKATPPVSSKDGSGKAVVTSPEAASPGRAANESGVEEYEPDVEFKPIVTLPEAVDIKTGEEEEEEEEEKVFGQKAKLFRTDPESKQWKERGVGELKIMRHKSTNRYRIVMRREQVLKLCVNHHLSKDMKLLPMVSSDKAWCWYAQDFAEEEIKSEQLAAKFNTPDIATMFKESFEVSVQKLSEVEDEVPDVTPEVSPTGLQAEPKAGEGGSLASLFKKTIGDWECNICYVKNKGGVVKCVACETPKPGVETPQSSEVPDTSSVTYSFGTKSGFTNVSFRNVTSTSKSSSVSKLTSDDKVTESSTVSLTSGVKGFSLARQPGTGIGSSFGSTPITKEQSAANEVTKTELSTQTGGLQLQQSSGAIFKFGSTPTTKEQSEVHEVKKSTVSKQTGDLQLQQSCPAPFTFAPTLASKEQPDSTELVQDTGCKFGGFGIPSINAAARENNTLKEYEMNNRRPTTEDESILFNGNAELHIFDVGYPSLNLINLETKFKPPSGQDTPEEGDTTKNINTRHMCITAMEEYRNQSLEELRSNYYAANRNNCNAGCSSGKISLAESLFGNDRHSSTTRQVNFGENTIEFCFGGVGSTLFSPSAVGGNSAGISGSN